LQIGYWKNIQTTSGRYLEVKPNFLLQTIDFVGFNVNNVATTSFPKRYMHTAVAVSTGFTRQNANSVDDKEAEKSDNEKINLIREPRESLMVYGGSGERNIALGNDWNQYGMPWGGSDPDLFAICLDKSEDRYCLQARNLGD
tara:strand:- start:330 stop:755 length:426 start_codon:yes stop_codon:yes gene_type:complete